MIDCGGTIDEHHDDITIRWVQKGSNEGRKGRKEEREIMNDSIKNE